MKIPNKKNWPAILAFALLVLPTVVYGAGLIPCGETPYVTNSDPLTTATHPCKFNDLLVMANKIIHFLMIDVAVPLAALGFMYTGARLVLFPKKEGEWTAAKERFEDVAMGFGIMLGAYVLIKTILFAFLNTGAGFTLFLLQ